MAESFLKNALSKLSGFSAGFSLGGGSGAIGLSIGTSSVKIVQLAKKGKGWKLAHFGIIQLPEDAIVNREIVNPVVVVDGIRALANQLRLKNKPVCTSLSGTSLIIKRMQLEVPNPRELEEQVFWEAEQYIPFDLSEVAMDYQVLSRTKEGMVDVLLVAAKRSVLDSYMSCVNDAGLKPKIVDVDFFALQNLLEANYSTNPAEAVCIVDIGAASTKIVVVHDGVPVFTKDVVLGGRNLTEEIQKHLGLQFNDAETLKVGGSRGNVPQEVAEIIAIMCENFAGEVKRALDFYSVSSLGAPVTLLLLAGGSAKVHDLTRVVEELTGVPTQLANPFHSIAYDPSVFTQEYVEGIGPLAAIPVGLALRAGAK